MADQCEHSGRHGKCSRPSVEGSVYCERHCDEADRLKGYQISNPELRKRFEHHQRSDLLNSVRDEIHLLKTLIDDRLDACKSQAERISAFNSITPALVNVVKCFETFTKLERQNNIVLGKEALAQLSKEIVEILVSELKEVPNYEPIIDRVAKRIATALANARNQE